jgi:hypothetical protein
VSAATRLALLGSTVLLAAALSGCAGEDDPTAAPTMGPGSRSAAPPTQPPTATTPAVVDACALVSKVEAEKLVGTPLDEAKPGHESCMYTGPVTGPTAQVEVYVGDGAKKFLDIERTLRHELHPLAGVGDEAHIEDGAVFVHRSGRWVAIRFVRLDDPAKYRTRLEDLARAVAGRI